MKTPRDANPDLSYWEFRTLLELMMVSDPWPLKDHHRTFLVSLLNDEAEERGYEDWIAAYHDT
jgi:hypothetical protein